MRVLAFFFALVLAAPAAAQPLAPPRAPILPVQPMQAWQYSGLLVQQEQLRQEMIGQQNRLTALDAQLRAQQSIDILQAESHSAPIPAPYVVPGAPPPQIDTSQLGSIPDSILADSNKKVREAAGPQD
jgi:hypothetical protein